LAHNLAGATTSAPDEKQARKVKSWRRARPPLPGPAFVLFSSANALRFSLLDLLTHRCTIFEMNGESYRFRGSAKAAKPAKEKKPQSES